MDIFTTNEKGISSYCNLYTLYNIFFYIKVEDLVNLQDKEIISETTNNASCLLLYQLSCFLENNVIFNLCEGKQLLFLQIYLLHLLFLLNP